MPIERMKTSGIEEVIGQADAVAEQRTLGERARRIDRDHADRLLRATDEADQRRDEARLADAGRAGEADRVGMTRLRIDVADHLIGEWVAVLDERDRTRERAPVACTHRSNESLARPVPAAVHAASSARRSRAPSTAATTSDPAEIE